MSQSNESLHRINEGSIILEDTEKYINKSERGRKSVTAMRYT